MGSGFCARTCCCCPPSTPPPIARPQPLPHDLRPTHCRSHVGRCPARRNSSHPPPPLTPSGRCLCWLLVATDDCSGQCWVGQVVDCTRKEDGVWLRTLEVRPCGRHQGGPGLHCEVPLACWCCRPAGGRRFLWGKGGQRAAPTPLGTARLATPAVGSRGRRSGSQAGGSSSTRQLASVPRGKGVRAFVALRRCDLAGGCGAAIAGVTGVVCFGRRHGCTITTTSTPFSRAARMP